MKTVAVRIDYDPETQTYGATSDDVPDVYAVSDTRDDVLARFVRSARLHFEELQARGVLPASGERHEIVTVAIDAA
ncbi:MAG: hypothetical protein GIW95_10130 [Candidatus Eremiobacteraeota bacterium]|nr:hypothetical protein [Candidatus Eremiobacteraeota bacterium]